MGWGGVGWGRVGWTQGRVKSRWDEVKMYDRQLRQKDNIHIVNAVECRPAIS